MGISLYKSIRYTALVQLVHTRKVKIGSPIFKGIPGKNQNSLTGANKPAVLLLYHIFSESRATPSARHLAGTGSGICSLSDPRILHRTQVKVVFHPKRRYIKPTEQLDL
jgi:hypothetical protein